MKRTKVAFVTTSLIVGGQEKVLVDVANGMDREEFAVAVVLTKEPGALAKDLAEDVTVLSGLRNGFLGSFLALPRLMGWMKRWQPDCVFTFGPGDKFLMGRLAGKWAKTPVILSGLHTTPGPEHVGRSILGRWNKHLMGLNSGVVTVTSGLKEYLHEVEGYPLEKTYVIPNGVNTEHFFPRPPSQELQTELDLPNDAPIVSIVAALRKEKRHDLFLKAAALVCKEVPVCRFLVVGGGPSLEDLKSAAQRLKISSKVLFLGPRHDIPELLNLSSAAVLSSTDVESAPICMLEALASGVPQVAPSIGGIPDIVADGETGFLFPAGNVEALASHLITLFQDSQLNQRMAVASRRRAVEKFSVESMVLGHESIIRKFLPNPING